MFSYRRGGPCNDAKPRTPMHMRVHARGARLNLRSHVLNSVYSRGDATRRVTFPLSRRGVGEARRY